MFRIILFICVSIFCATNLHALPLAEYNKNAKDILNLYVSGASAQDNSLERFFRLRCEENTLDIYRVGGNQRLFFCTFKSDATEVLPIIDNFPRRINIAFFKSSKGGSGNGVGPLIQNIELPFINILDLKKNFNKRCPAEKSIKHEMNPPFSSYVEHICTTSKRHSTIPDAGISDVEPKMFTRNFGFTKKQIKTLSVKSSNALIFGVPVSLNLRNALQSAQFSIKSPCHPENEIYERINPKLLVPYGESNECMPGLTQPQLAGIFAGAITDWRQILNSEGYPMATIKLESGEISVPPTVTKPSDTRVHVCRRVDTSGTQASFEMYFLNQRCSDDVESFVKGSRTVLLGSGTSDVKYCLNYSYSENLWSVGIFSTENVADLNEDKWRFIKINQVSPTLLNTYLGKWTFFIEQTIQWRNENSDNPLEGFKLTLMNYISKQVGNPNVIQAINSDFRHTWGNAGIMALNTNNHRPFLMKPGSPLTSEKIDELPVLPISRATLGYPNNCSPPLAVFPTPAP